MSVYPKNVGFLISKSTFSISQIADLKKQISPKVIIRIYGLSGVGKGTLSEKIAQSLQIPCLNTGLIWRAITYLSLDLKVSPETEDTQIILDNLEVGLNASGMTFFYKPEKRYLPDEDLKNPTIDKEVFKYAKNQILRNLFDDILAELVFKKSQTAIVSDGRGSSEPYLLEAEKKDFNVIRVLVDCSEKIKAERYFLHYIKNHPDLDLNDEVNKQKLLQEFEADIVKRDQSDVANILSKNLGLISNDTGILDNSYLNPQETLETALNYISSKV